MISQFLLSMGKCVLLFLPANVLVICNHRRRFCFYKEVRLIVKSPGINSKLETHLLFPLFAITDGSVLVDRQSHAFQTFKHLFAIKADVDLASLFGRPLNFNSYLYPTVFKFTRTSQNNRRTAAGFLQDFVEYNRP